jgi:hypothetical protein
MPTFWKRLPASGSRAKHQAEPVLPPARVYRRLAPCEVEAPSILKGGDHVKFIIATLTTFAVTATGIVPALANCCP